MKQNRFRDYILDDERDLRDRLFVLSTAVLLFSLCITWGEILFSGISWSVIVLCACGILFMTAVTMDAVRREDGLEG